MWWPKIPIFAPKGLSKEQNLIWRQSEFWSWWNAKGGNGSFLVVGVGVHKDTMYGTRWKFKVDGRCPLACPYSTLTAKRIRVYIFSIWFSYAKVTSCEIEIRSLRPLRHPTLDAIWKWHTGSSFIWHARIHCYYCSLVESQLKQSHASILLIHCHKEGFYHPNALPTCLLPFVILLGFNSFCMLLLCTWKECNTHFWSRPGVICGTRRVSRCRVGCVRLVGWDICFLKLNNIMLFESNPP